MSVYVRVCMCMWSMCVCVCVCEGFNENRKGVLMFCSRGGGIVVTLFWGD